MRLHTVTSGTGARHIAMVHGLGGDGSTWRDLADLALATGRFTITTVDLRGHGESDRASSYRVADFAADLVETLPAELDDIVSHSLGGIVVAHAIERLAPRHALYLDPGFKLALPVTGFGGWLVKYVPPALPLFMLAGGRGVRPPAFSVSGRALHDAANARWDRSMAMRVFRDVAFTPPPPGALAVPSTVVLSEDARFVVPDPIPADLAAAGWDVRRAPGLGHSLFLEDPAAVWAIVQDVI